MSTGSGGSPVYFVDRCLGKGVRDALRAAGANAEYLDDHFATDAADVDWLPKVARRGWIVLTKDKRIRRATDERKALIDHGARYFALTSGSMPGPAMGALLVAALPAIERVVSAVPGAVIAIVKARPHGEVEVIAPAGVTVPPAPSRMPNLRPALEPQLSLARKLRKGVLHA
jgi:hypothetical protein